MNVILSEAKNLWNTPDRKAEIPRKLGMTELAEKRYAFHASNDMAVGDACRNGGGVLAFGT
jgi:hypothetical protein